MSAHGVKTNYLQWVIELSVFIRYLYAQFVVYNMTLSLHGSYKRSCIYLRLTLMWFFSFYRQCDNSSVLTWMQVWRKANSTETWDVLHMQDCFTWNVHGTWPLGSFSCCHSSFRVSGSSWTQEVRLTSVQYSEVLKVSFSSSLDLSQIWCCYISVSASVFFLVYLFPFFHYSFHECYIQSEFMSTHVPISLI